MRTSLSHLAPLLLAVGISSTGAFPWPERQDPQEEQDGQEPQEEGDPREGTPFSAYRKTEKARVEKEIEGSWMLVEFQTEDRIVDTGDFRGFATINDGYMSIIFYGREEKVGLFGNSDDYIIQANAYRYRINDRVTLQLAGILGFTNATYDGDLEFDHADTAAQYDVTLVENSLTMTRGGLTSFVFRRLKKTDFPPAAIEALLESREWYGEENEDY
jgi:hypothetical protein